MAIYKSPVYDSIKTAKDNLRDIENKDYQYQLTEIESLLNKGWKQIYMLNFETIFYHLSIVIPETMATTEDEVIEYEQRNWDVISWFNLILLTLFYFNKQLLIRYKTYAIWN